MLKQQAENQEESTSSLPKLQNLHNYLLKKTVFIEKGPNSALTKAFFENHIRGWKVVQEKFEGNWGFDFMWVNKCSLIQWDQFNPKIHLINKVQGAYDAYCSKNGIYKTLRQYELQNNLTDKNAKIHSSQFIPETYLLNYNKQQYTHDEKLMQMCSNDGMWFLKSCHGCQGKGNDLILNMSQFKQDFKEAKSQVVEEEFEGVDLNAETHVIQKMVDPLLLNGNKFDLRVFILIASVKPFLLLYHPGYARRSLIPYSDAKDNSLFSKIQHQTNFAQQKNHPDFEKNKDDTIWTLQATEVFLIYYSYRIFLQVKERHLEICKISKQELKIYQSTLLLPVMINLLYGCDILFDKDFNPYLLEINANPSLIADTKLQTIIKPAIVNNSLKIALKLNMERDKIRRTLKYKLVDFYPFTELINEALEDYNLKQKIKNKLNPNSKKNKDQDIKQEIKVVNDNKEKKLLEIVISQNGSKQTLDGEKQRGSRNELAFLQKKYSQQQKIQYEITKLDEEINNIKERKQKMDNMQLIHLKEVEIKMQIKKQQVREINNLLSKQDLELEKNTVASTTQSTQQEDSSDTQSKNSQKQFIIKKHSINKQKDDTDIQSQKTVNIEDFTNLMDENIEEPKQKEEVKIVQEEAKLTRNPSRNGRASIRKQKTKELVLEFKTEKTENEPTSNIVTNSIKERPKEVTLYFRQGEGNPEVVEHHDEEDQNEANGNKEDQGGQGCLKSRLFKAIKEKKSILLDQMILNEKNEGVPFITQDTFQQLIQIIFENSFTIDEYTQIFEDYTCTNIDGLINYRYFLGQADNSLYSDKSLNEYLKHAKILADDAFGKIAKVIKQEKIDVKKAFRSFDDERKGYITAKSLQKSFKKMNFEFSSIEIDAIFYHVDKDKDNKISYQEFKFSLQEFDTNNNENIQRDLAKEIFRRIREVLKNEKIQVSLAFKSIDIDRDNKISGKDLLQSFSMMNLDYTLEDVKQIFKIYDYDKDGYLNYKEFVNALGCD